MSKDTEYNAGLEGGPDNVMGDDNNYRQISGSSSKVGRCVIAEAKKIDGEWIGNRAWKLLERAQDTPTNRQLFAYHTQASLKWLVDNKRIKDLEITTGDAAYMKGLGMLVKYTDVLTGDTSTDGFIAPWGKM